MCVCVCIHPLLHPSPLEGVLVGKRKKTAAVFPAPPSFPLHAGTSIKNIQKCATTNLLNTNTKQKKNAPQKKIKSSGPLPWLAGWYARQPTCVPACLYTSAARWPVPIGRTVPLARTRTFAPPSCSHVPRKTHLCERMEGRGGEARGGRGGREKVRDGISHHHLIKPACPPPAKERKRTVQAEERERNRV